MQRRSQLAIAATLATSFGFALLAGCATRDDHVVVVEPTGTPRFINEYETWWNYQFVYHPYQQVYYEPYSHTYWWKHDNGTWMSGSELPGGISLQHEYAEVVKLQHLDPTLQDAYARSSVAPHSTPHQHASAPYTFGY